ncbi:MAG: acetyl-CoA carboxylase biotin carboxyl carrier protein [Planctomycetota bacterium]|jgi:acetyl-CoA carboxylase biotin carboxyl carrier protein
MTQKENDLDKIKQLIDIMKENDLVEIEIKHDDDKIFLKRSQPQSGQSQPTIVPIMAVNGQAAPTDSNTAQTSAVQESSAELQKDDGLVDIKSPMVGTFYAAASPDSDPCVEIDSEISPQTVVCIIEAMKVMNEIKAEVSGTIVEILVTNGQAVEYGQVLFKVRPD